MTHFARRLRERYGLRGVVDLEDIKRAVWVRRGGGATDVYDIIKPGLPTIRVVHNPFRDSLVTALSPPRLQEIREYGGTMPRIEDLAYALGCLLSEDTQDLEVAKLVREEVYKHLIRREELCDALANALLLPEEVQ